MAALREGFIVDEEENQKYRVGCGEGDASNDVDRLRHADRVRWFFFADLDETWLKEINLQMNDDSGTEKKHTLENTKLGSLTERVQVNGVGAKFSRIV